MGFRVKLAAGSREFTVEGSEPILEAALRAGLGVPYGCSSGNCGACKARIVEGRVGRLRAHDFRLTEAEKLQGYALLCSATALSDLVVDAAVAHGAGEIPPQRIAAQVRRLEPLAGDIVLAELLTPRSSRLRFLAGQSATLELAGAAATLPIASCPCEERRLHFHLRRGAGHAASESLLGALRVGAPVQVAGPTGDFVLREDGARGLAFIAWGWQAFAPVKSLIEHALAQESATAIDLVWVAASPAEHYQENLCRAWSQAMDNFHYALLAATADPRGETAAAIERLAAQPERDFYIAGTAQEVAAIRALLAGTGVRADRLSTWSPA
ncbi:MAG TPA: 2Fe-2S iron-sulfur cluster-binding protein [Burkholderiales bacterium]